VATAGVYLLDGDCLSGCGVKPFVGGGPIGRMLHDAVDDPETKSPQQLRDAYDEELRAVVDARGIETVASAAGLSTETVAAVASAESPRMTLSEAAAVLATETEGRDADTIVREVRDYLLMGMTTGVLDVDTIASNVDLDLSGQEIQQAIEGRTRLMLDELAAIHSYVAGRNAR
jgi:hypothetical protein